MILAPMVRGSKGSHKDVLASIRKAGFLRARLDGEVVDVEDPPELARQKSHHIQAVIDRVVSRAPVRHALAASSTLSDRHRHGPVLATAQHQTRTGTH